MRTDVGLKITLSQFSYKPKETKSAHCRIGYIMTLSGQIKGMSLNLIGTIKFPINSPPYQIETIEFPINNLGVC